eukprot:27538-Eustigmatos_ZCMA.PRE.1
MLALYIERDGQAVHEQQCITMLRTHDRLPPRQHSPVHGHGLRMLALGQKDVGQVVHEHQRVNMLDA